MATTCNTAQQHFTASTNHKGETMTRPTKVTVDCSTGIQEIIELTDEEIAQMETDRVNAEAEHAARVAEAEAKAAAKAAAQAKLAALGLTAEEIAAL